MRTVVRTVWWAALLFALMGGAARGQNAAAPPQGTKVHMHGLEPGYAADGYLFQPQGRGPFGAVLLIADDEGIKDYVRLQGQALADAGIVAVAIDLYRGQAPAAGNSSQPNNVADLNAALNFLHSMPNVNSKALGVAGWGSGANHALWLSRSDPGIVAIALTLPDALHPGDFSGLHAALLGIFGEQSKNQLQPIATQMKACGCTVEFYFEPAAAARFYDSQDVARFSAEQAARGREHLQEFFTQALLQQPTIPK
jgi:dienelactone hydrolase